MLQSCKPDACALALLLQRPTARKHGAWHINLCVPVNGYLCTERVCASECKCDSWGEQRCSFLDATGLCLSITSSCLCHRRRVVHGREPRPTLLTQGQTHRHIGPGLLWNRCYPPHTHWHPAPFPLPPKPPHKIYCLWQQLIGSGSDRIQMTDYTDFTLRPKCMPLGVEPSSTS